MTREELKIASTEKLISALEYCGRDSYYATYYDEVVSEIRDRLNQLTEKNTEIAKLKEQLSIRFEFEDEWKREKEEKDKQIEELKKENGIMAQRLHSRAVMCNEQCYDKVYAEEQLDNAKNQIANLEAQIEKLEDKLANADYQLEGRELEIKELNEKLGKAKEIIKEFLRISVASFEEVEPEFSELVDDAEKFVEE